MSEIFCAPDDFSTYAQFCNFLASFYGSLVQDYVIWNEIQSDNWWSLGNWPNTANGIQRAQAYGELFWLASDAIHKVNPSAKIYISLDHTFDNSQPTEVSGYEVIQSVASHASGRSFHVAIHPYSIAVGGPSFSDADRPTITFGTINILMGYLQKNYPGTTAYITEVGFTSEGDGSSEQVQANALCLAYRQALATPGVTGFIYHRYKDNPGETVSGLYLGLVHTSGAEKAGWSYWALMDRGAAVNRSNDCGFELEGGTMLQLQRYRNPQGSYWVTTRNPLAYGYHSESMAWRIYRDSVGLNNKPIYDCQDGEWDHFLSTSADCENRFPTGMVGYVSNSPFNGASPIYRCYNGEYHFATIHSNCENWGKLEMLLGYAVLV
eukprot:TRINITY_DN9532_c0_g1_i2.p1 TRINITY_DN9532_c0_g1~~TRINITY_DN9532_c0_g1_i2.p1  ORF type:complete len:436 (+),score=52.63 TRINITY_DN9532_c0_g1_i2:172-1308(+)